MDGAPRLMSMTNVRALSRYRALREQQACRVMQADAAARDSARKASEAAAAALASAENDRSLREQLFYRDLAGTVSVTIEMLYRRHDELARLTEAVQGAKRMAEEARAALADCENELLSLHDRVSRAVSRGSENHASCRRSSRTPSARTWSWSTNWIRKNRAAFGMRTSPSTEGNRRDEPPRSTCVRSRAAA